MTKRNPWSNILFLAVLFGGLAYLSASSFAQDAPTAGAAAEQKQNVVSLVVNLVLQNLDPVFFIILALSVVALTLIISSFLRLRKTAFMPDETTNQIRTMIENRQFKELIEYTEADSSFIARSINPALKRAPSFSAMKEAMETAIGEQTAEQFRKIEYLNIIGNLGPLLGLLGTVLGMIVAFNEMSTSEKGADPSVLAGGVSKALAHTFMGLFLAVPALAAFGILRTIVDRMTIRASLICEELLLMIKPAEAKPATVAAPPTPVRPTGAPTAPSIGNRPRVNPVPPPPSAPNPNL